MIQVLDRALSVLEYIARSPAPCLQGDLAEWLGIQPSSCANLLKTLAVHGYVEQARRGGGYRLGAMALGLALLDKRGGLLARVADPVVHEVAETTGETTLVAVLSGARRLIVAQAEGRQTIRVALDTVLLDDLPGTATGLVLLAYAPAHHLAWIFRRWEAEPAMRGLVPDVMPALEAIRGSGTITRQQGEMIQIALPVRRHDEVVAAIGSFIPTYRGDSRQKQRVLDALWQGVAVIERQMSAGDSAAE